MWPSTRLPTPGRSTSWIQTSAAFGLFGALLVILLTRLVTKHYFGPDAFDAWGWRIPFLFSAGLLLVSIFMRLKLTESPTFAKMKAEGGGSAAPYTEAFGQWKNLKVVLLALVAIMSAQGAVWYTGFLLYPDLPGQVPEGGPGNHQPADDDRYSGQRGLLRAVRRAFRPAGPQAGHAVWHDPDAGGRFPRLPHDDPDGQSGPGRSPGPHPVVVVADPVDCSLQFDPVGKASFVTSCDIAKSVLANAGVSYDNEKGPAGSPALVKIGGVAVATQSAAGLDKAEAKALKTQVEGQIKTALAAAGYPAKADPARINYVGLGGILFVFVIAATALFGPIAACLVELFPTRIRYTAMSLPYHIGTGWIGGFVPFTAFAIVAAVGNIYSGLWYPFAFTALSVVTCLLFLPETKNRSLH